MATFSKKKSMKEMRPSSSPSSTTHRKTKPCSWLAASLCHSPLLCKKCLVKSQITQTWENSSGTKSSRLYGGQTQELLALEATWMASSTVRSSTKFWRRPLPKRGKNCNNSSTRLILPAGKSSLEGIERVRDCYLIKRLGLLEKTGVQEVDKVMWTIYILI